MLERKEFGKARNWLIINQSLSLFPPQKMESYIVFWSHFLFCVVL